MRKYFFAPLLLMVAMSINPMSDLLFEINETTNVKVENAGLKLPTGFSASALADSVGKARHMW